MESLLAQLDDDDDDGNTAYPIKPYKRTILTMHYVLKIQA